MAALIQVEQVSKAFTRLPGPASFKELLSAPWRRRRTGRLMALDDVSFEVRAGEMLGVVGANGAGKSTLLRLLGGIGLPTHGRIAVNGRIGSLLDLGGGFQHDLTGRENAMLAGVVAGLLRREVVARMSDIVRFAGLEEFIDAPVRTYSAGMTMRLAFAVAVHTDTEVLLIDEYLSVGDLSFQAKCMERIAELRARGGAIVFVSHGMGQIRELCDRALWLRQGKVVLLDSAKAVADAYEQEMHEETLRRTPVSPVVVTESGSELKARENRFGSMEMVIEKVSLRPSLSIRSGDPLAVEIRYRADHPIQNPVFSVSISRPDGMVCFDTGSDTCGVAIGEVAGSGSVELFLQRLDLAAGRYFIDVGVFEAGWKHAYDYHWHVYPLTVDGRHGAKGIMTPPCRWKVGGEDY